MYVKNSLLYHSTNTCFFKLYFNMYWFMYGWLWFSHIQILSPVASKIMIKFKPYLSGSNSVKVRWKRPKYDPLEYLISFNCGLKQALTYYLVLTITVPDPKAISYELTDLVPGTYCIVNLRAIYNPASIDHGISTKISTLGTRVCKYILIFSSLSFVRTCIKRIIKMHVHL